MRSSRGLLKMRGRALLEDPALVEEADRGGDVAGERHLVGRQDHGGALLGEVADDPEHVAHELGSRAAVISSRSSSVGWVHRARTSAARCCWPPDIRSGCLSAWSARPNCASRSRARCSASPWVRRARGAARACSCRARSGGGTGCRPGRPCPSGCGPSRRSIRGSEIRPLELDDAVVDVLEQVQAPQQRRLARPDAPIRQITSWASTAMSTSSRTTSRLGLAHAGGLQQGGHRAPANWRRSARRPSQS